VRPGSGLIYIHLANNISMSKNFIAENPFAIVFMVGVIIVFIFFISTTQVATTISGYLDESDCADSPLGYGFDSLSPKLNPTKCDIHNRGYGTEGTLIVDGNQLFYSIDHYSSPGGFASHHILMFGDIGVLKTLNEAFCSYLKDKIDNPEIESFRGGYISASEKCVENGFISKSGTLEITAQYDYESLSVTIS